MVYELNIKRLMVLNQFVQGKATPVAEQGYESWAEVTAAMADPSYSKDPAYQEAVKQKLANSEL